MDEIALLRAIRPDAPEGFAEPERGEVLCRLLAAAAGERAAGKPVPTAGWLRRASRRWRLRTHRPMDRPQCLSARLWRSSRHWSG